ncbi:MAG: LamG-like jellyroll fold domain-containing protein [Akkermansiaceae bacterium]
MRKLPILTSTLLGIGAALADYPATVLEDSPLAYFRFEEAAGASFAADSSGNGNDAADYADLGTGVIGVTGAIGNAIQFNGDGAIVTGLTFDPSTSDFSMEFLIKPDVVGSETRVVISNRDGEGLGRSNASIGANSQINSFAGGITSNSEIQAIPNDWQHVVYTYEDSTDTMRIFVNGVEGTPTVLANLATPRSVESGNGEWIIGAQKLLSQQFIRGIVDEVAIYDTRLDDPNGDGDSADSRITAHYEAYRDDTGIFNFNTDRIYADSGEPVELSWTVSPTMASLEIDNGVGDVLGSLTAAADGRMEGGVTVNPTTTTTYTLSGTNPFESDSLSVEVIVDALPVIDVFISDFDEVIATQSVELSWTITNADTSEIDQGIGALVTNPGFVTTGSQTVVINEATTFTLTATNGAGSVTAEVNITTREGDPFLLAHWKVGEGEGETEGATLISDTGDGLNGTFVGTPAFDSEDPAPVPTGSTASLVFDGNNSWVDILGWTGVGGSTPRTVAFWFKGEAPQTNNNATLVSWGTNTTGGRWDIRLNGGASGVIRTEVAGSGSNGSTFIGDNAWHHVAIVLPDDGSPNVGEALFYIDGQPDAFSVTGGTDINTTTTNNVRIGASRALANRSLTGKLDDIRVYNRALDAEEILILVEGEPIVEELAITSIVRNVDGSVSLEWNAQPEGLYFVEFSSTLEDGSWLEIADEVQNGEYLDTTYGPTNQLGFYRVREAE